MQRREVPCSRTHSQSGASSSLCPGGLQEDGLTGEIVKKSEVPAHCWLFSVLLQGTLATVGDRPAVGDIAPQEKAGAQNCDHFLCAVHVLLESHCDFRRCVILIGGGL